MHFFFYFTKSECLLFIVCRDFKVIHGTHTKRDDFPMHIYSNTLPQRIAADTFFLMMIVISRGYINKAVDVR